MKRRWKIQQGNSQLFQISGLVARGFPEIALRAAVQYYLQKHDLHCVCFTFQGEKELEVVCLENNMLSLKFLQFAAQKQSVFTLEVDGSLMIYYVFLTYLRALVSLVRYYQQLSPSKFDANNLEKKWPFLSNSYFSHPVRVEFFKSNEIL